MTALPRPDRPLEGTRVVVAEPHPHRAAALASLLRDAGCDVTVSEGPTGGAGCVVGARRGFDRVAGTRGGLRRVVRLLEKVVPTGLPVFLHGEQGTGKDLLARAIHEAGPRAERPFAVLRCAELPEGLAEAELFGAGSDPGAGRIAAAPGGTLVLDEVAALDRRLQARLARALEDADVRLVCTGPRDPADEVRAGRLREDLAYRLGVFAVRVPPLRERREDIPALVREVLGAGGAAPPTLQPLTLDLLEAYDWPGNVRELTAVLQRAHVLAGDGPLRPEHLPPTVRAALGAEPSGGQGVPLPLPVEPGSELAALEEVERRHILRAIETCRGNLSQAARTLEIGRTTLYRKLQRYGLADTGPLDG